jgi:hypothetical protein
MKEPQTAIVQYLDALTSIEELYIMHIYNRENRRV